MEEVHCTICGEFEGKVLFEGRDEFYGLPGQFKVICCARCDLGYISPRPSFNDVLQYYPPDYYSFLPQNGLPSAASNSNLWQKAFLTQQGYPSVIRINPWIGMTLWIYRAVRGERLGVAFRPIPRWQPGGRLLDVGCGSGFYLSEMKKLGWEVHGVEVSPKACAAVQSLYGTPTFCGSLDEAPFSEGSFDVITFWDVLEHLPNPRETLQRAYKLLRPNGYLLVIVPNRRSFYTYLFGRAYVHWELPRHLYHFSRKSLVLLAKKVGFKSAQVRTFSIGGDTFILSWGIRRDLRQGWARLPTDFWEGKTSWLRLLSWTLKPFHALIDWWGLGIHLKLEARKL